jgi:hypothetical protein
LIRRDAGDRWILISQVEHARLAGVLAEHWTIGPLVNPAARQGVLAAVYHHDDGWAEWEAKPGIDVATGRPLNFVELEPAEFLNIWRRSIAAGERLDPLAGYCVAGHFCALLRRFDSWRRGDAMRRNLAETFLAEYAERMAQWLEVWQDAQAGRTAALADQSVRTLQLMDALSLWLCTAERTAAETFELSDGSELRLQPQLGGVIELDPWPLDVPDLELTAAGRAVPVRRYQNAEELARWPSETVQLEWLLQPASKQSE